MNASSNTSTLDRVRHSLNRLEQSESSVAIKVAGRLVRQVGRFVIVGSRRLRDALGPQAIKRSVLFPLRNVLLRRKPVPVNVDGVAFRLVPEGVVPLELWSGGYFERPELEFILSLLQPGMTFVDIGANVGFFSIPAAKKLPGGTVLAFEPTAWTFERLLQNARLNAVTNLLPVQSAVGDRAGEALLQVNPPGRDGLNTIGRPVHRDSRVVTIDKVPVCSLDGFLEQHNISHVDVIKIDVEGAELFVLRGAQRLLRRDDAPLILYESGFLSEGFDYHPVEQMWLLEKFGYSFFLIDSATGRISLPPNGRAYDSMVIAAKPSHPCYPTLQERLR